MDSNNVLLILLVFGLIMIILIQWIWIVLNNETNKSKFSSISRDKMSAIHEASRVQEIRVASLREILRLRRKYNKFHNAFVEYHTVTDGWDKPHIDLWFVQADIDDSKTEKLDDFRLIYDKEKKNKNK